MWKPDCAEALEYRCSPSCENRRSRSLLRRLLQPLYDVDAAQAADALVAQFGSLRAILAASPQELHRAVDDRRVVRFLGVVRRAMRWTLREAIEEKSFLAGTEALRTYLRFNHGCDRFEQVRVFYLDVSGNLIREEAFARGTSDQVALSTSSIIKSGLNLDARYMVMAHNHPSGDPAPSRDDLNLTRRIATASNLLGITLYDHLIVAEGRDFSFRENDLL